MILADEKSENCGIRLPLHSSIKDLAVMKGVSAEALAIKVGAEPNDLIAQSDISRLLEAALQLQEYADETEVPDVETEDLNVVGLAEETPAENWHPFFLDSADEADVPPLYGTLAGPPRSSLIYRKQDK